MKLNKRYKLVYGVGINDVSYNVHQHESVNGKQKIIWSCPFYVKWKNMLERCYSIRFQIKRPSYKGCSTVLMWHRFSNFKAWMEQQDWEGKQLDKDIIIRGNKIYGPDTCLFVDQNVNQFLNENRGSRGKWPIGVSYCNRTNKYKAGCSSIEPGNHKTQTLGYFHTPEEAHQAWLTFKLEQAKILASQQTDERVAKALVGHYENYNVNKEE